MSGIIFQPFPTLKTSRLELRQLREEDENEIYFLRSDETNNKYLDRPKAESIEDARNFINKINNGISRNEAIYWAVSLKGTPNLAGTICLWNISWEERKAELGYELLPEYQGKGLMQEAISSVLDYGFNKMHLKKIEAEVDPENKSSIKILERNKFALPQNAEENKGETVIYFLDEKTFSNN